jgi:FkbM family methyltransferase
MAQRVFERFADIADALIGRESVRTVVEVGARDCTETLDFHRTFPNAAIYTFECNPAMLPRCREAVQGLARIKLTEKAIGDSEGSVAFYPIDQAQTVTGQRDGNPGASSLFRAAGNYPEERYVQNETIVQATTLEKFLSEEKIAAVDLLWMDIQGAELLALKGMGERIATVKLLHLEVEFFHIYQGQPLFGEVHRFLRKHGFTLLGFTGYSKFSADAVYARAGLLRGPLAALRFAVGRRYLLRNRLLRLKHHLKRRLFGR